MNRLAALICFCLFAGPARAEAGLGEVWNELYEAREQRIVYAITADPADKDDFWGGLQAVVDQQGDPQKFKQAKLQHQIKWYGRIKDFSAKYKGGDAELNAKMAKLPKPDMAGLDKDESLKWFKEYDKETWGGGLIPAIWDKIDPYQLGYNIASLRSMTPEQREELKSRLAVAKNWGLSPAGAAGEVVKGSKKEFVADLTKAETDMAARAKTAREQLVALEGTLIAKGPRTGNLEDQADTGSSVFDGKKPSTGNDSDTSVVDARPTAPGTDEGSGKTPPGALQPGDGANPAAENGVHFNAPPPPKVDKEHGSASKEGGIGAKLGAAFKSPKLMAGAGALLGGILGFFLGGPIGALLGAGIGAAALGLGSRLLT